jgi:hypothetical protein
VERKRKLVGTVGIEPVALFPQSSDRVRGSKSAFAAFASLGLGSDYGLGKKVPVLAKAATA